MQNDITLYGENHTSVPSDFTPSDPFTTIANKWLHMHRTRIRPSTYSNYRGKLDRHILPYFGNIPLIDISADIIQEFIFQKQQSGLSDSYILDILVLLRSIFRYCERLHLIINPMDFVEMPRRQYSEVCLLEENEKHYLESYLLASPTRTNIGILLAMKTGIRLGELCGLQCHNIDNDNNILHIRTTVLHLSDSDNVAHTQIILSEPKSNASRRDIPFPETLSPYLEQISNHDNNFLLSGTDAPLDPRTLQYRFTAILKENKLPSIHFHALRHMFATRCVKLGLDTKTLSEILGHLNVNITLNRYVHPDMQHKIDFMRRYSQLT